MSHEGDSLRIYVIDAVENDLGHYDSWLPASPRGWRAVHPAQEPEWTPPADCGLVVTKRHYDERAVTIIARALDRRRVPILILADGILEYRNTWLHPQLVPGSLFQPVLGDKIACYGRSQARIIESWGNVGKCEVVGAPRLDTMLGREPRARAAGAPFRLLVATARTPGFTDDQTAAVRRSLADLRAWLGRHRGVTIGGRATELEPVWRLTADLGAALGVPEAAAGVESSRISDILPQVDAVITTPSTVILEAMLQGLPVATLDYTNSPAYVPTAWSISAPEHLDSVLAELIEPPTARMLFQETTLHDALECRSPAAERMIELTEAMIAIGERCRARGHPLQFPERILPNAAAASSHPAKLAYDESLYPGAERRRFLRLRVAYLERLAARQRATIVSLKEELRGKHPSLWAALARRLRAALRSERTT